MTRVNPQGRVITHHCIIFAFILVTMTVNFAYYGKCQGDPTHFINRVLIPDPNERIIYRNQSIFISIITITDYLCLYVQSAEISIEYISCLNCSCRIIKDRDSTGSVCPWQVHDKWNLTADAVNPLGWEETAVWSPVFCPRISRRVLNEVLISCRRCAVMKR